MITKEYEDNRKFMEVVRFFRNYKYDMIINFNLINY